MHMSRYLKTQFDALQAEPDVEHPGSLMRSGKRARVALLTMDFPPDIGGVQRYLFEISRKVGNHYDLTVVVPNRDGFLFQNEPFTIVSLSSSMPWNYARALATIRPHLTVVGHAHPRMLLPAAILSKGRFVGLAHGSDYEVAQLRWHAPIFNRLLASARTLIVGSRSISLRLQAMGLAESEVVYPGTDPHVFFPSNASRPEPPVLLTVSRLVPRKGHNIVLAALPLLLDSFPHLQYWIAGDGPERVALERLAKNLRVDHAVSFLGDVSHIKSSRGTPDLPEIYRRASIFVLPTQVDSDSGRAEGFGIVYLEASASGLPVVAARSGGAAEAVLENETGLLVPPDDPPALTQALLRLLNDSGMRDRMGRAGRRWVENEMNWDRAGRQMISIIERAL